MVSNENLLAACKAVHALTPEFREATAAFEAAQTAYWERGNEANLRARNAAKARLDAAQTKLDTAQQDRFRYASWGSADA